MVFSLALSSPPPCVSAAVSKMAAHTPSVGPWSLVPNRAEQNSQIIVFVLIYLGAT